MKKAQAFQALHEEPGCFVIPNAWDRGSARMLATLGFKALATTSAGFYFASGRPDGTASLDEVLAHCRDMAEATDLPISADMENCYADTGEGIAESIRLAVATSLSGCSIKDMTDDPDNSIFEFSEAVDRVNAAVEAVRTLPHPFTLTARAENFIRGNPDLDDTIKRLQASQEAGADVLYAPSPKRQIKFVPLSLLLICQ